LSLGYTTNSFLVAPELLDARPTPKVAGRWVYLYRAIDQYGQVIDVLVSRKRDLAATRRFFTRALNHGQHPAEVSTDRAPAYPRVLDELLPSACHVVPDEIVNREHSARWGLFLDPFLSAAAV
jgi:transposase, IS6 family